ncbi:MAG: hypothetical protein ACE5EX_00515 [Phycisphaerae bacterium]
MKPRLLILIALAGGMAVYVATRASAPAPKMPLPIVDVPDDDLIMKTLQQQDLPGEEPEEECEFSVGVEVDPSDNKNRLYYYIDEAHGYFVESLRVEFWFNPTPENPDNSTRVFREHLNAYIKANETLFGCLEAVPGELDNIGNSIGTSENWEAYVVWYHRARVTNPDPFPLLPERVHSQCD